MQSTTLITGYWSVQSTTAHYWLLETVQSTILLLMETVQSTTIITGHWRTVQSAEHYCDYSLLVVQSTAPLLLNTGVCRVPLFPGYWSTRILCITVLLLLVTAELRTFLTSPCE